MNRYFKLAPTHFKLLTIVFLALLGISAQAQSPQLLKDIYPGTESSYPFHLIELGNKAVFVATDNAHGLEMWVTDGTPGNTTILKDIASGVTWGQPRSLAKMNGKCYFVVDSSTSPVFNERAVGLWETDGTPAGTQPVKMLSNNTHTAQPSVVIGDSLMLFPVYDSMQARRLYRSDGTASGTYPLTDTSVSVFLGDNDLVAVNGYAYFPIFNNMGTIDLWKSDGTPSGTAIVKGGFYSGGGYGITGLDAYGNLLVFTAFDSINGRELWRSDGTEAGTFMIKDINTGSAGSIFGGTINVFMEYGGEIFFEADDGINGEELWKSDGTEPGTVLVKNLRPGSEDANISNLHEYNGYLYFTTFDFGTSEKEIYRTDGTTNGTVFMSDIGGNHTSLEVNNTLFFITQATTASLAKTDGTMVGIVILADSLDGEPMFGAQIMGKVNGHVIISGSHPAYGWELWGYQVPACYPLLVSCVEDTVAVNVNAVIDTSMLINEMSNGCTLSSALLSQTYFGCGQTGLQNITVSVVDVNGDSSSCVATVNVSDQTPPTLSCADTSITINCGDTVTFSPTDISTTSDNCGIHSHTIDGQNQLTIASADLGANVVTVAAGDGAGNVSNCHSIITVSTVDANAPVAVCQPTTVAISLTGVGMLDPATIDGGSADNCGIATLSADVTHFSCPDIGTTNVVLTVEDAAGNSDNCNAIVTIEEGSGISSPFSLETIDGTNGVILNGFERANTGIGASPAGDINNDGIPDIAIGGWGSDPNGVDDAGRGMVIFGQSGMTSPFDLGTLNGTNGFYVNGVDTLGRLGWQTAPLGDINNDGIDDIIIGQPNWKDGQLSGNGKAIVIYGKNGGFAASYDTDAISAADGMVITGASFGDMAGMGIAGVGDINGDGIDDIGVGSPAATVGGDMFTGISYVIYGSSSFGANFDLNNINGTNGFAIEGNTLGQGLGTVISPAGDLNNDGFDDMAIGAPGLFLMGQAHIGTAYIIYGNHAGFSATMNVSDLDGTNGFAIPGLSGTDEMLGFVSAGGDINGDNIDDLMIGVPHNIFGGSSGIGGGYIVHGNAGGFSATFDLATLNGTNGTHFTATAGDGGGFSMNNVGDLNSDGLADIMLGSPLAFGTGGAYLVYGQNGGFGASFDLTITSANGIQFHGTTGFDGLRSGPLGDFNNDGKDDIFLADLNHLDDTGRVYIFYGFDVDVCAGDTSCMAPVATCQDATVTISSSPTTLTTGDVDNGSVADCGLQSMSVFPNSFTCADAGTHAVNLTVVDDNGDSATCAANVEVVVAVPAAPSGFTVTQVNSTSFSATWNADANATGYRVQYLALIPGNSWQGKNTSTNSITVTGLVPDTEYLLRIRSNGACGNSAYANKPGFTTPACDVAENLNITNLADVSATMNWDAVSNASGYKVGYRKTGTSTWTLGNTIDLFKNATSLIPGTQYDYRVRSECTTGWGTWTGIENFTTSGCTVPSNLVASNIATTSAAFNWDVTPEALFYKFFYRESGGSWTTFNAATNAYSLIGLAPSTTYYVGVKAVCPYGITPASTIFIFTTAAGAVCDIPANPVASGITSNTATVSWDAMPDAIKYKISYRELPSGSWTTNNVFTNSRVLTGLNPNATYDYRLMTHCPSGLTPLGPANFFTTAASRLAAAGSLQDEMQIQLFPNPTNGIVNVVVSRPDVTPTGVGGAAYPARATIEVFDLVGRPVYRWEGDVQGTFIHPIDLSGNAEGQYLVKTSMNGKVESRVISLVK